MLTVTVYAKHEAKGLNRSARVHAETITLAIENAIAFLAKQSKTRKNGWTAYGIKIEKT